ncbi:MAG: hypothetical protein WC551_08765 [Patescibacteria group bacterium]
MDVQTALIDSFGLELRAKFNLIPRPGELAHDHYNRLYYSYIQPGAMVPGFGYGPEYPTTGVPLEYTAPIIRLSDGEATGFSGVTRRRRLSAIAADLCKATKRYNDEFFGRTSFGWAPDDTLWPEYVKCIAVYPESAGSDGYNICVDIIFNDTTYSRRNFMTGRTRKGLAHAQRWCNKLQNLLGV